ncbi:MULTISPECIES: hypothetical protein [unclassified Chryseobacterium]|uniref:hypothetical protein n=1 Tax=unclassified Chryseobacterium TaxID=2593645 RepID=UPI003016EAD2
MKSIKIKYNQLLFLYAYLRLINLSLDRSRWTSWDELQGYFKNIITPSIVIKYLMNSFNLPQTDLNNFAFIPKEKSLINRLRPILFKTFSLKQDEILYCCKLLSDFDHVLNSNTESYHLEIEKIRINIATYNMTILGRMILWKDLDDLMRIEHFWQNDKIETIGLKNFIPDDFN